MAKSTKYPLGQTKKALTKLLNTMKRYAKENTTIDYRFVVQVHDKLGRSRQLRTEILFGAPKDDPENAGMRYDDLSKLIRGFVSKRTTEKYKIDWPVISGHASFSVIDGDTGALVIGERHEFATESPDESREGVTASNATTIRAMLGQAGGKAAQYSQWYPNSIVDKLVFWVGIK